jgi:PAS domain S-box-containing protein
MDKTSMTARRRDAADGVKPSGIGVRVQNDAERSLDALPLPLLVLDVTGRVTRVNEAWRRHLQACPGGLGADDGVGTDFLELIRALGASAVVAAQRLLDDLGDAPGAEREEAYRCQLARAAHWFKLSARRLTDGVLLVHHDISAQHRAQAQLHVQNIVTACIAERRALVSSCQLVLAATCERFGWDWGALWVPDHWEKLLCADIWATPEFAGSEFENDTRSTTLAVGEGLPGHVYRAQRSRWLVDILADDSFPRLQRARSLGLTSGCAVPLVRENQVVAVLEFFSSLERAEDRELLDFLSTQGMRLGAEELRARANVRAAEEGAGPRMTRTQLEAVIEHVPGFILAVNRQGKVIFINRVMAQHRRDEITGSQWLDHVRPSHRKRLSELLEIIFETGTPQRHEATMIGPDGREMWLSSHLGPIRENGEITGVVVSAQDVTELKRAQSEITATQRWVSVGTLAAGIAHEINTPVQLVSDNLGFIRDATRRALALASKLAALPTLILEGAPEPQLRLAAEAASKDEKASRRAFLEVEVPKAVEACVNGLDRVATIVHSLQEFAHPASTELEQVELNRLIERVLAIAANEYRHVADLKTELGDLPPVQCNVGEITQAVLNVVRNAAQAIGDGVKGSAEKGVLEIRSFAEDGQAVIAIRDTGSGIPMEIRSRIFDPFFTTREVGKGSGQGLALAWAILTQKHRGSITFESTVGKGTTFFLRLPIARTGAGPE